MNIRAMNICAINIRMTAIGMLAAVIAAPALAQDAIQTLPTINTQVVRYLVDCNARHLPTQREVGEWTGQSNFSQVYDTREHLMAQIGRSCQKAGIQQVQLVMRDPATVRELDLIAMNGSIAK